MDYELLNQDEVAEDESSGPVLPEGCSTLFKPHEEDCTKYLMCNYGVFTEQT